MCRHAYRHAVAVCYVPLESSRRGGHSETQHVHTRAGSRARAIDMPSAMADAEHTGREERGEIFRRLAHGCAALCIHMRVDICTDMRIDMRLPCACVCYTPFETSRQGGHFEYRHVHAHAVDMPSAMADVEPSAMPIHAHRERGARRDLSPARTAAPAVVPPLKIPLQARVHVAIRLYSYGLPQVLAYIVKAYLVMACLYRRQSSLMPSR